MSPVSPVSRYMTAQRSKFSSISVSGTVPSRSRQYAISLSPTLIPSIGPLIDALVASGVSRYGGFKLLERVALYASPGIVKPVPGNKEDVFKSKQLSLLDKRRLMRFLMFAGGEFEDKPELQGNEQTAFPDFLRSKFSLKDDAVQAITYALAFCLSPSGMYTHSSPSIRCSILGAQTLLFLLFNGRAGTSAQQEGMALRRFWLAITEVQGRLRKAFVGPLRSEAPHTSLDARLYASHAPSNLRQSNGNTR